MGPGLKIWLKVIIGFVFSLTLLLLFLTFSLFGVAAEDTVQVIVTEATGMERDVTVFTTTLRPMIIHNVFWLCLAGLGFFLIFLYFIDHSFKAFLAPAVLTLLMTFFVGIVVWVSLENIFAFAGTYGELYLDTAIARFRQVVVGLVLFGAVQLALANWGDSLKESFKRR